MKKLLPPFFFIVILNSCANIAYQEQRSLWDAQKKTCNQSLLDSRFDGLRKKIPINSLIEKASFIMLANNELANDIEKALIIDLALIYEECYEKKYRSFENHSKYMDTLGNINRQYGDIHLALIVDLFTQKITYGKYNKLKNLLQTRTLIAINNFQIELDKKKREDRRDYRMSQPTICNVRGLSIYCN